jgi:glycosyltransferase involved in cell wall biosynthesis
MSFLELHGGGATSCGYHRIDLPFSQLRADLKVPVLVFNRYMQQGVGALVAKRRQGFKIVADLDDFWDLPPEHYLAAAWNASGTPAKIRACLAAADVVLVTNAALADHVHALNPNVVIVPNALPFDEGQFTRAEQGAETFVYAGGPSHVPDVAPLAEAFNDPCVVFAGDDPRQPEWLKMRQYAPRARYVASRPVSAYMPAYDGHIAALAPLADNPFNRCKSSLKMLEAGAKGLPLIASNVSPYANDTATGNVLLAGGTAEWQANMRFLRERPARAAELGEALAAHVREHYQLRDANEIRRQVLESFA